MGMTWTTQRPTVAGWYWRREPHWKKDWIQVTKVYVENPKDGILWASDTDLVEPLSDSGYNKSQWSGPIPEPGEERLGVGVAKMAGQRADAARGEWRRFSH